MIKDGHESFNGELSPVRNCAGRFDWIDGALDDIDKHSASDL